MLSIFCDFVKLLEDDLAFARAVDDQRFQLVVASTKRFACLDKVGNFGRGAEPPEISPSRYRAPGSTQLEPAIGAIATAQARIGIKDTPLARCDRHADSKASAVVGVNDSSHAQPDVA